MSLQNILNPNFVSVTKRGFVCEAPNSDANRYCKGITDMMDYLREAGAKTIVFDAEFSVWRCTDSQWVSDRKAFSDAKQRDCDRYGCE